MSLRKKIIIYGDEIKSRMDICKRCKFFVPETQTCGKAAWKGAGQKVKFRGKEQILCGCVMPIKSKIPWSKCPLGKWGVSGQVGDPETLDLIVAKAEELIRMKSSNATWRNSVKELYGELLGEVVKTNCTPCIDTYYDELVLFVREYRKC